ncbi:MAG: 16S rRNA (cytidine(1402)-2'-O)-methyltransferase [Oscillospiraceae bacterium]|nr:16S rRNA (cytidine(1402)-2'-O)-methyltransferase [Oscillospiraceae bacterium]MBR4101211.1 16S rRNA (cytidine(1402)-2'-O)-methyltransferase [Oscillospiraceae bacterium]
MSGILYVTGTPIGNLEDITLRQLRILEEVDFIAAEDTRVTRKLLTHFELKTPLVSYHDHSGNAAAQAIADRIAAGESCAIVTDAGMPCISDPGEELVRICRERGISVQAVPGPSAVVTALSVSGGSTAQFVFYGFLPVDKKPRNEMLTQLQHESRTAILYEAPHKLCRTIADLRAICGDDRVVSFCRELTKVHEEVLRMALSEADAYYAEHAPRGEFVLVLDGAVQEDAPLTAQDALTLAQMYLSQGMSAAAAAKMAAKETGLTKNEVYRMLHQED